MQYSVKKSIKEITATMFTTVKIIKDLICNESKQKASKQTKLN